MKMFEEYKALEKQINDVKKQRDDVSSEYIAKMLDLSNKHEEEKRKVGYDSLDVSEQEIYKERYLKDSRSLAMEGSDKSKVYIEWLDKNQPQLYSMRNKLLDAGTISWSQVIKLTVELMGIYHGKAYVYKQAKIKRTEYINGMVPYLEWDDADLIICSDKSVNDEFSQSEINVMCSQGDAVLLGKNIAKRDMFSFIIDQDDSLEFVSQFENASFVLDFFKRAIDYKMQTGEELNSSNLCVLKNMYLLDNLEMLEQRYDEIERKSEEEKMQIVKRFEENREFRAKTKAFIKKITPLVPAVVSEE